MLQDYKGRKGECDNVHNCLMLYTIYVAATNIQKNMFISQMFHKKNISLYQNREKQIVYIPSCSGNIYGVALYISARNKGGYTFHPVEVKKDHEKKGFVEIKHLSENLGKAQFALNGAYYLLSEMKKAETGEED